ncbi:MAG: TIGR00159 family protein [Planctomycetes bacterium]|nr:TIGR00159 family protein [Planctomycetota bacterium]
MLIQTDIAPDTDRNTSLLVDYFRQLGSEAYNPWVILIEFLLIGVIVYCTLRFLQGTRGARLMRGVGVVVVASFVVVRMLAERFGWERIEFLYQYFVLAVFLITLVVFQPELRRGLMRIGERLWFTSMYRVPNKVIEPLVLSVSALSKKHIGAIIAIERVSGLGAIVETGVRLDARLSADLLNTIFWPGSALHDMGVLIRQDRIVAAGCQFPLAEAVDFERGLGSRHRAALGLSEESDAIIVVVSEETGSISLASDGELHRALSPEVLQTMLYELLLKRQRLGRVGTASKKSQSAGPSAAEKSAGEPEEELCSK